MSKVPKTMSGEMDAGNSSIRKDAIYQDEEAAGGNGGSRINDHLLRLVPREGGNDGVVRGRPNTISQGHNNSLPLLEPVE